jgi:hypothetical protein
MLEFLIDNFYVFGGDPVFQLSLGILMGMNWAVLLADLFLYSYEAEFIQKLLHERRRIAVMSLQYCQNSVKP